jgi:hypothetical protein
MAQVVEYMPRKIKALSSNPSYIYTHTQIHSDIASCSRSQEVQVESKSNSGCVLLQNLSVSEARGKILHYRVTLQEVTRRKTTLQNITGHTSWTWVVPRTGTWTVAVSAVNSKGSSLPTCINVTDLCGTGRYQLSFTIACRKLCLTISHLL